MGLDHSALGYDVRFKASVVHSIKIGESSFEYYDLYDALADLEDHVLTNTRMIDVLKAHGIITSAGSSRWASGGTKGPNYDEFMEFLRTIEETSISTNDQKLKHLAVSDIGTSTTPKYIVCSNTSGLQSGLTVGRKYLLETEYQDEERVRVYNDLQKTVWYDKWRFNFEA